MRFLVAAVGKPRDAALAAATRNFELRAARYWPLEVIEVREAHPGPGGFAAVRRIEAERLLARTGAARVVLCDAAGRKFTSEAFAGWMQEERERARDVAFLIGGANGTPPSLGERAAMRLSLAPWTLPHELARLVLAEQLYRAGTILRREPYHK